MKEGGRGVLVLPRIRTKGLGSDVEVATPKKARTRAMSIFGVEAEHEGL